MENLQKGLRFSASTSCEDSSEVAKNSRNLASASHFFLSFSFNVYDSIIVQFLFSIKTLTRQRYNCIPHGKQFCYYQFEMRPYYETIKSL